MRWRRNERRPKWFKAVRRLDEAEGKKYSKSPKFKEFKSRETPYKHGYKRLKIDGKTVSSWKEPEPLLDVFSEEDCIVVVAELKGVKRENIKINVETQRLTLSVRTQNCRYYKRLNLPEVVIPEAVHTAYKNGVLEIKLKKAVKEDAISKLVG